MNSRRSARTTFSDPSNFCLRLFRTRTQEISCESLDRRRPPSPGCSKGLRSLEKTWTYLYLRRETGLSRLDIADPALHPRCKAPQHSGFVSRSFRPLFCWRRSCIPGKCRRLFKAAFFDLVTAFQAFDHFPMGMKVLEVHVEEGRIGSADICQSSFAAPEFDAALVARIEDPHNVLKKRARYSSLS